MLIKILAKSSTFNAVDYSEKKMLENKASLMSANNFNYDVNTPKEIENYFKAISELNPRVKNKQFHATVSAKGKSTTFKELENVAKDYMKEMGYDKSPFVIYSHNDTDNNHVHIVASRISHDGKKISDSLEKVRTQEFIKNKLQINFSADVKNTVYQSLNYKFDNIKALQSLLKKQGYSSRLKGNDLQVIKSGKIQHVISEKELKKKKHFNKLDFKSKNKIKPHLDKYAQRSSDFTDLKKTLHKNFGYEMILEYSTSQKEQNQEKRKREVISYNLIDHNNKSAYNETDLLSVEKLKKLFQLPLNRKQLAEDIFAVRQEPKTFYEVKRHFKSEFQLELKYNGELKDSKDQTVGNIDEDTLNNLKYNQRIYAANRISYTSNTPPELVAFIHKVEPEHLNFIPREVAFEEKLHYKELALSMLKRNLDNPINTTSLKLYRFQNQTYLLDKKEKIILDLKKDLNIEVSQPKFKNIPEVEKTSANEHYPSMNLESLIGMLSDVLRFGADGHDEKIKKRKRKRGNNLNQ